MEDIESAVEILISFCKVLRKNIDKLPPNTIANVMDILLTIPEIQRNHSEQLLKSAHAHMSAITSSINSDILKKLENAYSRILQHIASASASAAKGQGLTGKIKKSKVTICNTKYVVGYKSRCLKTKCEVMLRELNSCSDEIANEMVDDLVPQQSRADIMSRPIVTICRLFGLDSLFEEQMQRYLHLQKRIYKYISEREKKYISADIPRPRAVTTSVVGADQSATQKINDLVTLQASDKKILDHLIKQSMTRLTDIEEDEYVKAVQEVKAIASAAPNDNFWRRQEIKRSIGTLESIINGLTFVEPKIAGTFRNNREFLQFFSDVVGQIESQLLEAENKYNSLAMTISDLIKLWEIIIGPDTSTCIMQAYTIINAVISADVLDIIADVRFKSAPECMTAKAELENKYKLPSLQYYDQEFLWDNINSLSDHALRFADGQVQ